MRLLGINGITWVNRLLLVRFRRILDNQKEHRESEKDRSSYSTGRSGRERTVTQVMVTMGCEIAPLEVSETAYMIIAACGFVLFYVAGSAAATQLAYPPFGLASVSFTGLACYLIYTGLYSSAISVSQDSNLRQSIRKSAIEQTKFLQSIGKAQMEQELQKRVLTIAKKNSDIMAEETGVQPSLNEDDMKQYLEEILKEIKVMKV